MRQMKTYASNVRGIRWRYVDYALLSAETLCAHGTYNRKFAYQVLMFLRSEGVLFSSSKKRTETLA